MKNHWVFALCMAVMWGIVFANAMDNAITGICMGLLVGMAFGLFDCAKDPKDTGKDGK